MRPFTPRLLGGGCLFLAALGAANPPPIQAAGQNPPSVLVLYDGPEIGTNPGYVDAIYLANLLGHFTTRRKITSLERYPANTWKSYDAVFCVVYNRRYKIPETFLSDAAQIDRPFCWLGNQVGQLDRVGLLQKHGVSFERLFERSSVNQVLYKGRVLDKGDPDTNIFRVVDPGRARVLAWATGPTHVQIPYIIQSGSFWVVADSPFSYSSESDRYLAFADVLHDILGINHPEDHRALLRIEDINAMTKPEQLEAVLAVIRKHHIPFSFGFIPMYVNPSEGIYLHLTDAPDVVRVLQEYVRAGGVPVLHGYTHQHRGVTADDYEFWDDLGDRPVRADSEGFVARRVEQAIKESMNAGLYPITWETPHYAASDIDYKVFHRTFATVYERRMGANHLDNDECFPYPVTDLYNQYIIPEDLAYVPIENPVVEPVLKNAEAVSVVRDGYASVFFHPFLNPELLDRLIAGIQARGYHFVDLRGFPNVVQSEGNIITTQSGGVKIAGEGRYLNEEVFGPNGELHEQKTLEIPPAGFFSREIKLEAGETYVAMRQDNRPPGALQKLIRIAKGDFSVLQRKLETVLPERNWQDPLKTIILWNPQARGEERKDQESFYNTLNTLGFDIERINVDDFLEGDIGPFTLLVIPWPAARSLPAGKVTNILSALKGGIDLLMDGESPLSEGLGIQLGKPTPVYGLVNPLFMSQEYHWSDHPSVPYIIPTPGVDVTAYYSDRDTQHPLMIGGSYGQGKYLYFSPLYDPSSNFGYSRFPDLPSILLQEFHLSPLVKRAGADAYFDPGYRQSVSIERLARMWKHWGIRTIHAAAWHFYDKYTYDYARLIKVAHQNGILVDAWFEWPHVSERFWNQHPEWREKTALLTDAHVDWRYLMNLQNPQCLKAILEDAASFLQRYDWDGVDIAELGFESLQGPEAPQFFTPFNPSVRKDFREKHGFDPIELMRKGSPDHWKENPGALQTFYEYRRKTRFKLLDVILSALRETAKKGNRPWDIAVTVIDTLQRPALRDYLGVDMESTLKLTRRYGVIPQIEDPASEWDQSPDRYVKLGQRYKTALAGQPYGIDINVLPVHAPTQNGFATAQPTGSELLELWRSASSQASRVCFYSESTLHEQDWELLPYAMAAEARVTKDGSTWVVRTPRTVTLTLGREARRYKLDGELWPCADKGDVLIPPGEHTLTFSRTQRSWLDTEPLQTHLLSLSGELLGCQHRGRGLEIEYLSPARCLLVLNKEPYKIFLDDAPARLSVLKGDDGFVITAPAGQHRVRVLTQSPLLYIVGFMSLVSASLIVLFGMASSSLLAILFLFITLRRRVKKIRRFAFGNAPPAPRSAK
jgi:uncharacterized protein YdaL